MATPEALQAQIVDLQMLVTHLQHDLQTLNGVILDQQKQLDRFREIVNGLDDRVSRLGDPPEKIDPSLDRPPHY